MVFILFLYLHVLACFIYYVMNFNQTWVPPSESLGIGLKFYESEGKSLINPKHFEDINMKYWTLMYYSVLMYLVNETAPSVLYER